VQQAARDWAAREAARHPEVQHIGYFGSYARGDAGVGSDLDLVAIVDSTARPFEQQGLDWDLSGLPVPAEILVYACQEWLQLVSGGRRFARVLAQETVWLHPPDSPPPRS
jgi:hypothetical protein